MDFNGSYAYSNVIEVDNSIPTEYALSRNYPNPFNPSTIIRYQLSKSSMVTLEIYNMPGQKVRTLINSNQDPGKYSITWDGSNNYGSQVSSGIYNYRINAGEFTSVKKMLLIR